MYGRLWVRRAVKVAIGQQLLRFRTCKKLAELDGLGAVLGVGYDPSTRNVDVHTGSFNLGSWKRAMQVSKVLKVNHNWNDILLYMILKIIFKIKLLCILVSSLTCRRNQQVTAFPSDQARTRLP